jgi:hypothetical protein
MGQSANEYLVKVALAGDKNTWRIVAIRGDCTLHELHGMIFVAFERFDEHLYSFYIRTGAGRSKPKEFAAPAMFAAPEPFGEHKTYNAAETTLDSLGLKKGQRFEYLFDYGDCWEHDLKVEDVRPAQGDSKR